MWSEPRRAHRASVIVYSAKFLGMLAGPAIGLMALFGQGERQEAIAPVALIVLVVILVAIGAIALAWAEWYRFTFHIEGRTLRVEHGLIVRKSTRLTPERIQSIDTKANLLFRILGLVTVDVHTAGRGQVPEVSIPALTEDEARSLAAELRPQQPARETSDAAAAVSAGVGDASTRGAAAGGPAAATGPASGPAWRLSFTEILLVGATSAAGLLAFAAILPVAAALIPIMLAETPIAEEIPPGSGVFFAIFGGLFALMLFVGWIIGTVTTALKYWDFVTVRTGDEVRVERGLLQRETRNVPLGRIQAIRLVEGPLRQALGRLSVGVDAAGIAAGGEMGPTVLHPLLLRPEAVRFVDIMAPGHRVGVLLGLPQRARRRYVIRAAAVPLLVTLPLVVLSPWGWLALALPVAAALWGLLAYSDAAWAVRGGVLAVRYRHIARTTVLVRRLRVQSVTVSQHPLQSLAGLATLVVRVASSPAPATFRLAHLAYEDALHLVEWVSDGVEGPAPVSAGNPAKAV